MESKPITFVRVENTIFNTAAITFIEEQTDGVIAIHVAGASMLTKKAACNDLCAFVERHLSTKTFRGKVATA